ncbi:Mbeg1-like protein [Olsenella urininfantis]|uniref:Mbeg1-like protein n=1 Tax=Olsenella urininfantis TaxID=1871033 RepID=UPI0009863BFC|nr:Mbeg1-like protein [Olsenella urininfantis]
MANMADYLLWRGDLSFEERALGDIDALILSCLSYLDFGGIVPGPGEGGLSLAAAASGLLALAGEDLSSYVRSLATLDANYLRQLGCSRRFGDCVLRGYVDVIDVERSLQFAALQIVLPSGDVFVSFRGTDSTLVGWREDFMMSFVVTEAQRQAASYCADTLRSLQDGAHAYLGGHSKGGNLVAFAAVGCPEELRGRIRLAYSFDGPGIAPEVAPLSARAALGERFRQVCPEHSIIGMLLSDPAEPRCYVKSSASGMQQHDPMTWQLGPAGFALADGLAREAELVDEAIAQWVASIDLERRSDFVGELFDVLAAGGATTFAEVLSAPGIQQVLRAAATASPESRELVGRLASQTMEAYRNSAGEQVAGALAAAAHRVAEVGEAVAQQAAVLRKGQLLSQAGGSLSPGDAGDATDEHAGK